VEYVREYPPAELLRDCPAVPYNGDGSNGSVVQHIADLRHALRECAADKTALRDWARDPK